eukprot:1709195-Pleurochrysis_carterae.AAC.1
MHQGQTQRRAHSSTPHTYFGVDKPKWRQSRYSLHNLKVARWRGREGGWRRSCVRTEGRMAVDKRRQALGCSAC